MMHPTKFKRDMLGFIPAIFMGVISMITFVAGLSFDATSNLAFYVGVALAICNTIIQVMGNDKGLFEMDPLMAVIWVASYIVGITTSAFMLHEWLHIDNQLIEWVVAGSVGAMIEIVPEKSFMRAWKAFNPQLQRSQPAQQQQQNRPTTQQHVQRPTVEMPKPRTNPPPRPDPTYWDNLRK